MGRWRHRWYGVIAGVAALWVSICPASPVHAQDNGRAPGSAIGAADRGDTSETPLDALADDVGRVPTRVVRAATRLNEPGSEAIVAQYLAANNALPRLMAARALVLIRAARARGVLQARADVTEMADTVRGIARRAFNAPRVFDVSVADDFFPPPGTIALDFGPEDSRRAAGFAAVSGRGEHLRGDRLRFLTEPGLGHALLSDGVAGVSRVQVVVPNGTYRVILLTRRPPGPHRLPQAPFGHKVLANAVSFQMGAARPDEWLERVYLANPVFADAGLRERYADLKSEAGAAVSALDGRAAAVSFKIEVTTGFISVEFRQDTSDRPVYLTGALVEPADRSSVWMRQRARADARFAQAFQRALDGAARERVAAVTAYAVHRRPADAARIVRTAVRIYPGAAPRIEAAVAGLDDMSRQQIASWIGERPDAGGLGQAQSIADAEPDRGASADTDTSREGEP